MPTISVSKRLHQRPMHIGRRDLACLQRWIADAAQARINSVQPAAACGPGAERRLSIRAAFEAGAQFRPISAGGIGMMQSATVIDVSVDGIALRSRNALNNGQSISVQINPPAGMQARRRARERPIDLLAVVRYCRAEADSFILGCSFGVEWAASLASEMFPADLVALRKSA